jgi:prepilin-type N-terminal cleavage/methylation domain-containing protein
MQRQSCRGFSLTELLIVVAVGTIILTFAVPAMQASLAASRLQSSAIQLASELNFARTIAVSRNAIFEVRMNAGQRSFQIVDPADPENPPRTAKPLDQNVRFGPGAPASVRFFPRGHSEAVLIPLFNEFGRRIVVQVSSSGMVEVQEFQTFQPADSNG